MHQGHWEQSKPNRKLSILWCLAYFSLTIAMLWQDSSDINVKLHTKILCPFSSLNYFWSIFVWRADPGLPLEGVPSLFVVALMLYLFLVYISENPHRIKEILVDQRERLDAYPLWEGNVFRRVCLFTRGCESHVAITQACLSVHEGVWIPCCYYSWCFGPHPGTFKIVQLRPHCARTYLPPPPFPPTDMFLKTCSLWSTYAWQAGASHPPGILSTFHVVFRNNFANKNTFH